MLICKQPNKNKKEMKTRFLEEKLAVLSETPKIHQAIPLLKPPVS